MHLWGKRNDECLWDGGVQCCELSTMILGEGKEVGVGGMGVWFLNGCIIVSTWGAVFDAEG